MNQFIIFVTAILIGAFLAPVKGQFDFGDFNDGEQEFNIINNDGELVRARDEYCTRDAVATRVFVVDDHQVAVQDVANTLVSFVDERGNNIRMAGTLRYVGTVSAYLDGLYFDQTAYFKTNEGVAENKPMIAMPIVPSGNYFKRTTIEEPSVRPTVSQSALSVGMFSYVSNLTDYSGAICFHKNPDVDFNGTVTQLRAMEEAADVVPPASWWTGQYAVRNVSEARELNRKKRQVEFSYDIGRLSDILRNSRDPCDAQFMEVVDGTITTCEGLHNFGVCVDEIGWQCMGSAWDHHLVDVHPKCNSDIVYAVSFVTQCQSLKIIRETAGVATAIIEQLIGINSDVTGVLETQKVMVSQNTEVFEILRDQGLATRALGTAFDGLTVDVVGLSTRLSNQTSAIWTEMQKLSLRVYMLGEENRQAHDDLMATASMLRGESNYRTGVLADKLLEANHYFDNITTDHTAQIEENIEKNKKLTEELDEAIAVTRDREVALRAALADFNNVTALADAALAREIHRKTMTATGSSSAVMGLSGAIAGGTAGGLLLIVIVIAVCCSICK